MTHNPFSDYPYLILFYYVSKEMVEGSRYMDFPRNPWRFLQSVHWQRIYRRKAFIRWLSNAWGFLTWPYMGISSGPESYSLREPLLWIIYALPTWEAVLWAGFGQRSENFVYYGDADIPWLRQSESLELAERMADFLHGSKQFLALKEVILHNRCHEDFSYIYSNVKVDFYRKYYHSRAKFQVVPLTKYNMDKAFYLHIDDVESKMRVQEFLQRLGRRDLAILMLLYQGYKLAEIADRMGYASHSGVSKRIAHIRAQWREYQKPVPLSPKKPPEEIRYDVIEFSTNQQSKRRGNHSGVYLSNRRKTALFSHL